MSKLTGRNNYPSSKDLVDFILSGKSTLEARDHFGFININIASGHIHRAFRELDIPRPRYNAVQVCEFCKEQYKATIRRQVCCQKVECVKAYHTAWKKQKYHRCSKTDGLNTTRVELWNFAAHTIITGITKVWIYITGDRWQYRLDYIRRSTFYRPTRLIKDKKPGVVQFSTKGWNDSLKIVQIEICYLRSYACISMWEKIVLNIQKAFQARIKIRGENEKAS